jgi:hypothetical protein
MRSVLVASFLVASSVAATASAQLPSGHFVVLGATPTGGSALVSVDPGSGAVVPLPTFSTANAPPLACVYDPIARHVVVAVATGAGSTLTRVDPVSGFERVLGTVQGSVVAIEVFVGGDLLVLTGGPTGELLQFPRNGGAAAPLLATPHATAAWTPPLSPFLWLAQCPPGQPPTVSALDVPTRSFVIPATPIPGLTGARITGIADLPTGAIRQVLTDDLGRVHLFEFLSSLRTLAVTPALPAGGAVAAVVASGATSLDVVVLGDGRHRFVTRVPVFGAPPTATPIAGPLPVAGVAFDVVDAAVQTNFGAVCAPFVGAGPTLAVPLGGIGSFEWSGGPSGAPALAVFGTSEQRFGFGGASVALPVALPGGCPLLVAPDVQLAATFAASGSVRVQFPVPPGLPRGFALYAQWVVVVAGPLATSPASVWTFEP